MPATEHLETIPITQPAESNNSDAHLTSDVSPQKQFLARIRSYPIVSSFRTNFFNLPCTRNVADALKPSLKIIRNSQPLKLVMDRGDLVGLYALDSMDHFFPSLQNLEPHDITDPVTKPLNGAVKTINETLENATQNVSRNLVEPSRERFVSIFFNENGKGVITSQADVIFAPINANLESLTQRFIGDNIRKVPKESAPSEILRTPRIIFNALGRVREPKPKQTENATSNNTDTPTDPITEV